MKLVLLGPPGIGKGTQAQNISNHFSIPKISTGDILREAVRAKNSLGQKAKKHMDSGSLVPDDVVIGIIRERLEKTDIQKGFLLDGFPRTLVQGEALGQMLSDLGCELTRVLYFELEERKLISRFSGRRSCSSCQAVYHVDHNPPKEIDRCDQCGKTLIQREDDLPETVEKRLQVYKVQTEPLIAYYKNLSLLSKINSSGDIQTVFQDILNVLAITENK